MSADDVVLVLFRASLFGEVKTRLAATTGDRAALDVHGALLTDLHRQLDALDCPVRTLVDRRAPAGHVFWAHSQIQACGDLGARMSAAIEAAFADGFQRAVLIGSDTPHMGADTIRRALGGLRESDVVLGPAADGGYYLIGFRRSGYRREVFQDIPWSTETVFADTRARAHAAGLSVAVSETYQDIDIYDDLVSVVHEPDAAERVPALVRWWRRYTHGAI